MIPLNSVTAFRHREGPTRSDNLAVQAATSLWVTRDKETLPHVGRMQVLNRDRYDSRVVAFNDGDFEVSHC